MKISSKKIDSKPRLKASPPNRAPMFARAKKRLAAAVTTDDLKQSGHFTLSDRSPRGRKVAVVFGNIAGYHRLGSDPAISFAYTFRRALAATKYSRPAVKVYGPDGETVIATIDPETRKRTPVSS